jgi:uncharacterized membrane protein YgcG
MNAIPPRSQPRLAPRRGMTVFEVFLALTLLLGAMAVLSQHIAVGSRAAVSGRLQTQAALYGDTKLNEVLGGVQPLSPVAGMPVDGAPAGWTWSLDVVAGPAADLLDVTVKVTHTDVRGQADATFTVRRLMRDPVVLLEMADAAAAAASASSSTSSSSSSPSGSSSTGSSSASGSNSSTGGASR